VLTFTVWRRQSGEIVVAPVTLLRNGMLV